MNVKASIKFRRNRGGKRQTSIAMPKRVASRDDFISHVTWFKIKQFFYDKLNIKIKKFQLKKINNNKKNQSRYKKN